jgi:hypothetical protein
MQLLGIGMKDIAVAAEFAEKVALARVQFKNATLSQLDLDWHETKWLTFLPNAETNSALAKLTNLLEQFVSTDKMLRSSPQQPELFLSRAQLMRELNQSKHELYSLLANNNTVLPKPDPCF